MDEVKAIDPQVALDEVRSKVEEKVTKTFESRLNEFEEKIQASIRSIAAELKPKVEVEGPRSELRAVAEEMIKLANGEKRALTLSGAGAYNVLKSFETVVATKHDILGRVRYIYGAGAQTNIPVISTRPARPAKQDEGATGISADSTAAQGVTTITPYAYISEIFVSAENLVQGAASIEALLPDLFGEAFANAQHYGMIVGDGTMTGVFADSALSNGISCEAAGSPTWTDFINFAGVLKTKAFNPIIITSPSFISNLLLANTSSMEGIKAELQTRSSIRGIPVIEDPFAPTTTTAGSVVAVGMDLNNYVIGMARELVIEPIRAPGTAGVYFHANAFFNGKPVMAGSGWQLKAKAAGG